MLRDQRQNVYIDNLYDDSYYKYKRPKKGTDKYLKIKEKIKSIDRNIDFWNKNIKRQTDENKINMIKESIESLKKDKIIHQTYLDEELKLNTSHKTLKRTNKKRTNAQIKKEILKIIDKKKSEKDYRLRKEDVAFCLQVDESQVEQVFMELNRNQILSQPIHRAPHDSKRDPYGFDISEWGSDIYYIK